ncbi:Glyoxylate/hydroxypyruvate reductase hpr3-like protein [Quillaja saponaria]|uniref:glyoxylate reductase (NADP(+)) n=1 Tax=Quillaja saponaria TaxID=32244 RepID=A0AAD7L3R2_QUISA|nr:Glyoxylate/hydroxypyruvate reductase hpr3-like protein [Quillaja saponaria]
MADSNHQIQQTQKLIPQILAIGHPSFFKFFSSQYIKNYNFINPWGSPLPLDQFLTTHNTEPSAIRAIVCTGIHPVTTDVLRLLPSVELVVSTTAGLDHIDLIECRRRSIQVSGVGGLYSEDVADMGVGLLIDVMRKISAGDRYVTERVKSGPWHFSFGSKLGGKRVGIVGLGRIGLEVAKRLEAFGCIILYHSKKEKQFVSYPFYSNVVELAAKSNALVICCALTEQTLHLINKEVMLALGKEGILVNIGRGALIDENEMVRCLMEGEIGGAGLDVFENEPHVPKELVALDNVVLSPHASVFTSESEMALSDLVAENLEAFFSNKPLITPVRDN